MPFSSTHSFSNNNTIIQTSYISYYVINTFNIKRLYHKGFYSFAEEVVSIDCTHYMTSFDIDSLFTNIPLEEAINIDTEKDFQNKTKVNNLTKESFRFLLDLSNFDSFFILMETTRRKKTVFLWVPHWVQLWLMRFHVVLNNNGYLIVLLITNLFHREGMIHLTIHFC